MENSSTCPAYSKCSLNWWLLIFLMYVTLSSQKASCLPTSPTREILGLLLDYLSARPQILISNAGRNGGCQHINNNFYLCLRQRLIVKSRLSWNSLGKPGRTQTHGHQPVAYLWQTPDCLSLTEFWDQRPATSDSQSLSQVVLEFIL